MSCSTLPCRPQVVCFFPPFSLFYLIEVGQVAPEGESGDESEDEEDDVDARSQEEEDDDDEGSTVGHGSAVNITDLYIASANSYA